MMHQKDINKLMYVWCTSFLYNNKLRVSLQKIEINKIHQEDWFHGLQHVKGETEIQPPSTAGFVADIL